MLSLRKLCQLLTSPELFTKTRTTENTLFFFFNDDKWHNLTNGLNVSPLASVTVYFFIVRLSWRSQSKESQWNQNDQLNAVQNAVTGGRFILLHSRKVDPTDQTWGSLHFVWYSYVLLPSIVHQNFKSPSLESFPGSRGTARHATFQG